jgi:hypothetical protein
MTTDNKLEIAFGRRTYPDTVRAIWGARLIYPNDLVHDRQDLASHDDEARAALIAWLNGPSEGDGAISKMQARLADTDLRWELGIGDHRSDTEAVIYEDKIGKIIGSPQSSHGNLYVCGWLKEHVG